MDLYTLLVGAAVGSAAMWVFAAMKAKRVSTPQPAVSPPPQSAESTAPAPPNARTRAIALAKSLEDAYQQAERGSDLEPEPRFVELTTLLASDAFTAQERLAWATSQTMPLSCASLSAIAVANDDSREDVARLMGRLGYFPMHFAIHFLRESTDANICGLVLLRAPAWWTDYPATRDDLGNFLDRQEALGVKPSIPESVVAADWTLDERRDLLRQFGHPLIDRFLIELERIDRARRGQREVSRVGRVLTQQADSDAPLADTSLTRDRINGLVESLLRPGRPSFVLVGPEGAGKTTLARAALRELARQGWRVIEATPSQMIAGQKFIGEIEQRVENFVAGVGGECAVWYVPDCHQLLEQGVFTGNPHGLLDQLIPHLERGNVQLLGESTVAAWTRVLVKRPRVESLITGLRVEPFADVEALALARDWATKWSLRLGREVMGDAAIVEACEMARQQFPERAEPGRSLDLLKEALAAARQEQPPLLPLDREQLLATLARSSGLPLEILDIGRALDVVAVRSYFSSRVIGQDEAVDCLVDRISMLKAGLTDPRRPIGVFLFAGPTGTGKTEIAKTLASFLFGSSDRMLRVDMSEYQSEDSQWRLLGDGSQDGAASLVSRVRQNPFSVILLDEFEKAHSNIWDLFLQVFDDGRLTDRSGNTADFRHCIIVLTSNLGSTIAKGGGVGFVAQRNAFSRELVDRAINTTFRREFINRLDRVVVFNPLTRALMRDILQKELRSVLERRGFRNRDWAVEWESSAVEFLLDRGFTPDLGARPLRRAIDQYLLAPLSRTIVEHRVPVGEQFLFVRGDGDSLQVQFVDPDAPVTTSAVSASVAPSDLRALALDPRAGRGTLDVLQREIQARDQQVSGAGWFALKDQQALEMQRADFWQRPERQSVLDRMERIDRIESGVRSAAALVSRLGRSGARGAGDVVRRLALLVASLELAIAGVLDDEPEDARLEVRPGDSRSPSCIAWRDRVADMYVRWGKDRGIRVQRQGADPASGAVRLDVSGLGAYQALRDEVGMHVLETRSGDTEVRYSVRVSVNPEPANASLQGATAVESRICRRYDDGPAPLVRDNVRGWRSGRLDRVLAGDFDLMGAD
jgi:ATP-dependent Clp protease ATP-binding subunit ClpC